MTSTEPLCRHDDHPVLFVADLHLDRQATTIGCFRALCAGPARKAEAVYILGDLFDVWIGDDDPEPAYAPVFDAIAGLTQAGVDVRFIAGNRDFLIGEEFCRRTGLRRLDDHTVIDLFGRRTLLCHGDTLCTDDTEYQGFRAQVRTHEWQQDFLAKPLAERRQIAEALRGGSRDSMSQKQNAIMDVNTQAVHDAMRQHEAERLIHGHTHRPGRHRHEVDGATVERHVLSYWPRDPSMIVATADELRVEAVDC